MSCFVISPDHLDQLLEAYYQSQFQRQNFLIVEYADETLRNAATYLLYANHQAYRERYDEDYDVFEACKSYDLGSRTLNLSRQRKFSLEELVQILKLVQCYEYQAIEWEKYEESTARTICTNITQWAITQLPGWGDAKWSI